MTISTDSLIKSRLAPSSPSKWVLLIDGGLLILLGAVVILGVDPQQTDTTSVRIFGAVLCVAGGLLGARLWGMTRNRDLHPMLWLMSIVPLVLGIILLIWPVESQEAIRAILAIALLIRGILEASVALSRRSNPGWPFLFAHGLASVITGILFWLVPSLAVVLLILFMGIDLVMQATRGFAADRAVARRIPEST